MLKIVCALVLMIPTGAPEDLKLLLTKLSAESDKMRHSTVEKIVAFKVQAIEPLVEKIAGEDHYAAAGARLALQMIALQNPDRQTTAALMEQAQGSLAPKHKQWLLRLVSFTAQEEDATALADLILDPDLGETALWVLSRIPGPAPTKALLPFKDRIPEERMVSYIQALSASSQKMAGDALLEMAKESENKEVRLAAVFALSRLPIPEAEPVIWKAAQEFKEAMPAYGELAQTYYNAVKTDLAVLAYEKLVKEDNPVLHRCAGLQGLVRIKGEETLSLLEKAITGDSEEYAGAALDALSLLEKPRVVSLLFRTMGDAAPDVQIRIIDMLGKLESKISLLKICNALHQPNKEKQLAACRALGHLKDSASAPSLVKAILNGEPEVRDAASAALMNLKEERVLSAINKGLKSDTAKGITDLILSLGRTNNPEAVDSIKKVLSHPEAKNRIAAIQALGVLNHEDGAPLLLEILRWGEEDEVKAASHAITYTLNEKATKIYINALEDAPDMVQVRLLNALARRENIEFVDVFLEASKRPSLDVAAAAFDALAPLKAHKAKRRIIEAAKHGWAQDKFAAIRAYLKLGESEDEDSLSVYQHALGLANRDEERALAIKKLGSLKDPRIVSIVTPYLDQDSEKLKAAAANALAPAALKMEGQEAIGVLKNVVKFGEDPDMVQKAVTKLFEMGVNAKPRIRKGYVSHFWINGPFSGRDFLLKNDLLDVGKPVDITERILYQDKTYDWKAYPLGHIQGRVNLLDAVFNSGDVGAYLFAEILVEKEQDASFLIGSDDDVFCWLNGERVHRFEGGRGWTADQDKADVTLKQGSNQVLLKVLNGGGGWDVSLRITDRDKEPLDFEVKK